MKNVFLKAQALLLVLSHQICLSILSTEPVSPFQVCFLPLMLVNVIDDGVSYPFLHIIASVLAWASAVINPFIYAFKNRQYQQAFAKVIGAEQWCRRIGVGVG